VTDDDNVVPVEEMNRRRRVAALVEDAAISWRGIGGVLRELGELGVPTAEWLDLALRNHFPNFEISENGQGAIAAVIDIVAASALEGKQTYEASFADMFEIGSTLAGEKLKTPPGGWLGLAMKVMPQLLAVFAPKAQQVPDQEEYLDLAKLDLDRARQSFTPDGLRMKAVIERLFASQAKVADNDTPALECFVVLKAGQSLEGALSVTPEGTLRLLAMNQRRGPRGEVGPMVAVEHFFDYEQVADIAVVREITADEGPRIHTA
jgi:hypothetical protein